jgi:integrase
MPKLTNRLPALRCHKSGQGVVTISYRDYYLGKHGTLECKAAYNRLMAEYLAADRQIVVSPAAVTVADLVNAFRKFAEQRYRHPDGRPTGEAENYRFAAIPLLELFADKPAAGFGPKSLKLVRQQMISKRLARTVINRSMNRIKFMFKHGVEDELIPPAIYEALRCVEALRRGEAGVREKPRVLPVTEAMVKAVLPHLNRHVAAMVQLQLLTGMRPGEVCLMRVGDIDFASHLPTKF